MIKRYCDRCGQQIDEGVHAWYVLELHGTDGEFRHKELCEECYEYLCEKDEAPKADRKTESNSEFPNNCDTCKHNKLEWYSEVCDSCCGNNNHYEPKDEPQTETQMKTQNSNSSFEKQTDCAWK